MSKDAPGEGPEKKDDGKVFEEKVRTLNDEIEVLKGESDALQEKIVELSTMRRNLKKNLDNEHEAQRQTVREMTDIEILNEDQTAKGFVEKILKMKSASGSTKQLEDNILKLEAAEEQARLKKGEISKKIKSIEGQIKNLQKMFDLKMTYQGYLDWMKSYHDNEAIWFKFKDLTAKSHDHHMDYALALKEADIDDPVFESIIKDKLRPGILEQKTQADLVRVLSSMYLLHPNPWYCEGSRYSEKRIGPRAKIDPRRTNFLP